MLVHLPTSLWPLPFQCMFLAWGLSLATEEPTLPPSPMGTAEPMPDGSWYTRNPGPLVWGWGLAPRNSPHYFPKHTSKIKFHRPTVVKLLNSAAFIGSYSFLISLPLPLPVFPAILSQIYYLYLNLYLWVWENPNWETHPTRLTIILWYHLIPRSYWHFPDYIKIIFL